MGREKIDVNSFIDSKSSGGIGGSDIMKALEDIDYDISQVDIDSVSADDLDSEDFKELECATTSFGQGISVTPIQLVSAFASCIIT